MTINWKSRDTVFRLLVAVYLELGETTFRGRYGRIAEIYGADATYDAVKSFFAKEVARAAEDLRRNTERRNIIQRTDQSRQQNRTSRRRLHLDFDEGDISIVSERVTNGCIIRPLQAPAKRPRLCELQQVATDNPAPLNPLNENARANTEPVIDAETISPSNSPNDTMLLDPQTLSINPATTALQSTTYRASQQQRSRNKRPYTVIAEPVPHNRPNSPAPWASPVSPQESFGYVTNQGKYRCALCFSQVNTQEALDLHEAKSELHLRNLRNPQVVTNGRTRLAHVTNPATNNPHSDARTGFAPLRLRGFSEGGPSNINSNIVNVNAGIPIDPRLLHEPTQPGVDSTPDRIQMQIPIPTEPPRTSSSMDTDRTFSSATSNILPQFNNSIDKGKRRAASFSYPPSQHQPQVAFNTRPQPDFQQQLPEPPAVSTRPDPQSQSRPQLTSAEHAEILRTTGIRLAEKCIERHPDLIAQFHGHVLREAEAAAAMASLRGCGGMDSGRADIGGRMGEDVIVID